MCRSLAGIWPSTTRPSSTYFGQRGGGCPARSDIDALERTALSGLAIGDSDTFNDVADAITDLRDMAADAGSVTRALAQLQIRERTEAAAGPGVHLLNAQAIQPE